LDLEAAILNVSLLWLLTTPHEFAHAWTALKLGDDTPLREGRVTLHPLAHVDWVGTLILPAVTSLMGGGFIGWGRAVNTNPANLRYGRNGLALVALAGPASNVVFAVILAILALVAAGFSEDVAQYFAHGVFLSLYLGIFNMLPVPPLDGSKLLLAARLPVAVYAQVAQYGFLAIILAFALTPMGHYMASWAFGGAELIFGLVR
jgi:Zn-dependent protease